MENKNQQDGHDTHTHTTDTNTTDTCNCGHVFDYSEQQTEEERIEERKEFSRCALEAFEKQQSEEQKVLEEFKKSQEMQEYFEDILQDLFKPYKKQEGGLFGYTFDEVKAREIMEKYKGAIMSSTQVIKQNEFSDNLNNIPEKYKDLLSGRKYVSIMRPMGILCISQDLSSCVKYNKHILNKKHFNCDDYPINDSTYQLEKDNSYQMPFDYDIYNRQRLEFTKVGLEPKESYRTGRKTPNMPYHIADILEGVELSDDATKEINYVVFTFNDIRIKVPVNGKKIVNCPFLIPLRYLKCYNITEIYFYDDNNNMIPYDRFNTWLIGGEVKYPVDKMTPYMLEYIDPTTDEIHIVKFSDFCIGFNRKPEKFKNMVINGEIKRINR